MNLLQTLLLSLVEGITEFLPISSTGHLILTSQLLKIPSSEMQKTFDVAIQLGAVGALLTLYWRNLLGWERWRPILIAFIPTGIIGFLVHNLVKDYLLGNVAVVLVALLVGGLIFLWVEWWYARRQLQGSAFIEDIRELSWKQAALLGVYQAVALIPGVSRAGAVIIGGLLSGLSRVAAVEFSFLVAIPTMLVATVFDVQKSIHTFSSSDLIYLAIGFFASFVSAWIVVKWFFKYVQGHSLVVFGVYRIILAIFWFLIVGA